MTRITLTLRPLPSDIPADIRLRRALKALLRSFQLRCTSITETHDNAIGNTKAPTDAPTPVRASYCDCGESNQCASEILK